MIPRKKRIVILVSSIILVTLIIIGVLVFLFLKTDAFKSKETLFGKYLIQNFDTVGMFNNENSSELENTLNNSKYVSDVEGTIEYTEGIGTSNENRNNPINNVKIKINSNIDKVNNYDYKDMAIENENEELVGFEYLKQGQTTGIRLNGVQQFVSVEDDEENEILNLLQIKNIEKFSEGIDINSILSFTSEEKQTLANTYVSIIQSDIPKDRYFKQSNSLITVNNKDVKTNAYGVKLTIEEYNNLHIKILEQIIQDEIILSRIDLIEKEIQNKIPSDENQGSLRDDFINKIKDKIEEIKDNNIGNDEVKITVYESKAKTVRTAIEKATNKITLDLYGNSSIKIDRIELGQSTNEQFIKIEKDNNQVQSNVLIEYQKLIDNEVTNNISFGYEQTSENNQLSKKIELSISNEEYQSILNITNNIEIVQEFENKIALDDENIKFSDLQPEQVDAINAALIENIQAQLSNFLSKVDIVNYTKMLQNLELIKASSVQIPSEGEVTELERRRFNSQFEFFIGENLETDNIKELTQIVENNFEDMKILTNNGTLEDLDLSRLDGYSNEAREYKKTISEVVIFINRNSKNEQKRQDLLNYLESEKDDKYTISIEYDDDGLTRFIRMRIQER